MINDMRRKNLQLGDIALLSDGDAWMLVEFGGETLAEAEDRARALMQAQASHTVA